MARSEKPSTEPIPTLDQLKTMHDLAFEAEQSLCDLIAISKLSADALSSSIQIFEGQGDHSMFDAKRSILAISRLLEHVYDAYAYPLSIQLGDLVTDMQEPPEPTDSQKDGV